MLVDRAYLLREREATVAALHRVTLLLQARKLRANAKPEEALRDYQTLEPLCREANDLEHLAYGLLDQAEIYADRREYEHVRQLCIECAEACRDTGNQPLLGRALHRQLGAMLELGDLEAALDVAEEADQICRETGDNWTLGKVLRILTRIAERLGDFASALRLADEYIEVCRTIGREDLLALAIRQRELMAESVNLAPEQAAHGAP